MPTVGDKSEPESIRSTSPGRSRSYARLAAIVTISVVVADQLSKWWAVTNLSDQSIEIFGSDIGFQLSRNSGSALSLFQSFTPLLAILALILTVVLVRVIKRSDDWLTVLGLALILGGALGNLLDRIFRPPGILEGAVIDFVRVGNFPIFNVADSAITVGAIVVIVASFTAGRRSSTGSSR